MGSDCNFCQLTLFWARALKMEVFLDGFAAVAHRAGDLSIAGYESVMTPARLIVTACIASVMMIVAIMAGERVLVVVVFVSARFVGLIARVFAALFVRMLSVLTMHGAGLNSLVLARGETLLIVCIVGVFFIFAMLTTVFASTMFVVASHAAKPVGPALLQKMVELAIILLSKLMAAHCVGLNFLKLKARNESFAQARVVFQLKLLRKQLEHLFAKFATRAKVLRPVSPVEGHVKPFHGETCGGLLKVALG